MSARGTRKPLTGPNDPRHGSVNGYTNLACRCERCTEAQRLAMLEYNRSRGVPSKESTRRHGTSAYKKRGCRCDICRDAIRQEKARFRARRPDFVARENAERQQRHRNQAMS